MPDEYLCSSRELRYSMFFSSKAWPFLNFLIVTAVFANLDYDRSDEIILIHLALKEK